MINNINRQFNKPYNPNSNSKSNSDKKIIREKIKYSSHYIRDGYKYDLETNSVSDPVSDPVSVSDSDSLDNNKYIQLEKEFDSKLNYDELFYPRNHGNIWSDVERIKIVKLLKKYEFTGDDLFDPNTIKKIAKKLERTEYAVKEEIKKMIYNKFIQGENYENISGSFNIPLSNIKSVLKSYIDKNSQKIITQLEKENKILKLQIDNIKLKKELYDFTIGQK